MSYRYYACVWFDGDTVEAPSLVGRFDEATRTGEVKAPHGDWTPSTLLAANVVYGDPDTPPISEDQARALGAV